MDRQSFEKLFKDNYSKAYYLALRILHDDEASKDVVSDAFELVWKRVRYQDVDNISSYLLTTVKNVSLDYIRKQDIRSRYVLASMKETEMVVNSVYDHLITAKRKACGIKNEMRFSDGKTKCAIKKHPSNKTWMLFC